MDKDLHDTILTAFDMGLLALLVILSFALLHITGLSLSDVAAEAKEMLMYAVSFAIN